MLYQLSYSRPDRPIATAPSGAEPMRASVASQARKRQPPSARPARSASSGRIADGQRVRLRGRGLLARARDLDGVVARLERHRKQRLLALAAHLIGGADDLRALLPVAALADFAQRQH